MIGLSRASGAVGAVALLACAAAFPGAASAARPVPTCSWTPVAHLDHQFRVKLVAEKSGPYNGTKDCNYLEKRRKLDPKGQDLLTIEYQTDGTYTPPDGSRPVRGLGSCTSTACPSTNHQDAAYLLIVKGNCNQGDVPQTCRKGRKYIQQETLDVQDGVDFFVIQIWTLYGPLPAKNETSRAEKLARKLVPLFYAAS